MGTLSRRTGCERRVRAKVSRGAAEVPEKSFLRQECLCFYYSLFTNHYSSHSDAASQKIGRELEASNALPRCYPRTRNLVRVHQAELFLFLLFTIHYSLFTIHYSLLTTHYSLSTVHCSRSISLVPLVHN